ncbi:unnamed protein product [Caenorhabditis bovis]|uniref:mitogen-activated protein kinase kinase n=1 Tax=Caenorhabditis bovis TaxID=2654633 RepID=A0A8S1F5C1_9PELO|nr:unnamed protein product [Caenorhabditis bovis]
MSLPRKFLIYYEDEHRELCDEPIEMEIAIRTEKFIKLEESMIMKKHPKDEALSTNLADEKDLTIHPSSLQFGRYIGDGTHAAVRLGFHEPTNAWYAVKTILSRNGGHEAVQKEILAYQECSKSDFVVRFYGSEVSSQKKELVLEHMDRGDVKHLGILPVEIHQQVALAVIKGLRDVWQSGPGYIHRDIKPANILLKSDGSVKIADLGEAKRIDNTNQIACSAAGTLFYQSPEQSSGRDYDNKVDVWSYGLTLWELAVGENIEEYFNALEDIQENMPRIPGFPESLTTLIKNCLKWDPADRWDGEQIESSDYLKDVKIDREIVRRFLENT